MMATKPHIQFEGKPAPRKDAQLQLRNRLVAEYEELTGALGDGRSLASPPATDLQPAELPVDAMSRDVEFRCRENLHARLQLVSLAIERLDSGLYGTCEVCGEAIGARRLTIDAAASRCIECQSALERTQRTPTL